MNYTFPDIKKNEPLTLITMNGIGDLCWAFVKIANFKKAYNIPKIKLKLHLAGDQRDGRVNDIVERFSFVDEYESIRFNIHKEHIVENRRLAYIESGYNDAGEYTFIPNAHLEWQGRIEEIFPDVTPCYDFFDKYYKCDPKDVRKACDFRKQGKINNTACNSFICFHLGSTNTNTHNGMNRFQKWRLEDWAALVRAIRGYCDLPIYILGAHYDNEYALKFIDVLNRMKYNANVLNLCGKTSASLMIEMLRISALTVSFASGVAIASTYLGTPTIMFWMPEEKSVSINRDIGFSNKFSTNWVPPNILNSTYYPAFYFVDNINTVSRISRNFLEITRAKVNQGYL